MFDGRSVEPLRPVPVRREEALAVGRPQGDDAVSRRATISRCRPPIYSLTHKHERVVVSLAIGVRAFIVNRQRLAVR